MRIFLDENLSIEFAVLLSRSGHDAVCAREQALGGASDEQIWAHCLREQRILITLDSDFSDRRKFPPALTYGIVWMRTSKGQTLDDLYRVTLTALQSHTAETIRGKIVLIDGERVRLR